MATTDSSTASTATAVYVFVIPTSQGIPDYTIRCTLDGEDFNFRFLWNSRQERWYVSIYDVGGALLVAGMKLICNWPLLRYYQWDDRLPTGELMAISTSLDTSPPGLNDLGEDLRVQLTYYPKGVLPSS